MLKIKELPAMERPYEKLEKSGAEVLSNAELLAIIIKSGTKDMTSVEVARLLMRENMDNRGFRFLGSLNIEDLMKTRGIGKVKAIQLKAVFEIAKRINRKDGEIRFQIRTPEDIYNFLEKDLRYEEQEIMRVLTFDVKKYLIKNEVVAVGKLNKISIDIKDIFKSAISISGSDIILSHNHPSGDPTPSPEDIAFTKRAAEAGEMLDITVLDHVIIGNGNYISMRQCKII